MDKAKQVRTLVEKYFWNMPDDASLSTGKMSVLPEEASDFINEYAESLKIDMTGFDFNRYFPNEGFRFLPNALLPRHLRTEHHAPAGRTVKMLIPSAEAGRWLYP